MNEIDRDLTPDERQVIVRLRGIEKRWPSTLTLFVWSDTVCIMDTARLQQAMQEDRGANEAIIETLGKIRAGGGDPQ